MRVPSRFTALCVGVLLLAAPTAFGCGELGAAMMPDCPMSEMSGMAESMGTAPCHGAGQMAEDCCDVQSAPEPTQALTFDGSKLLVSLEASNLLVTAPLASVSSPPRSAAADAFRPHDLELYTLFSSFLI